MCARKVTPVKKLQLPKRLRGAVQLKNPYRNDIDFLEEILVHCLERTRHTI